MIRKAFKMKIFPASREEYIRRHNPIWPELATTLREHGVHDYSIFLDEEQSVLYAYAHIESEERWTAVAETDVCKRWWESMRSLMYTNHDGSPVSEDLVEVFCLE